MGRPGCNALQYSDQMFCQTCGLTWDVNDPDEPACRPPVEPTVKPNVNTDRKSFVERTLNRYGYEKTRRAS